MSSGTHGPRAPREFLFTLPAILGTVAVVLLVAAALVGGFAVTCSWNLGAEAIGTSGRRMRELEARGGRTLAEFDRVGSDAAWPSS